MVKGDDYEKLFRQLRQEGLSKGAATILADRFEALGVLTVPDEDSETSS